MTGRYGQQCDRRNVGSRARTRAATEVDVEGLRQQGRKLARILFCVCQAFGTGAGPGAGDQVRQRIGDLTTQGLHDEAKPTGGP